MSETPKRMVITAGAEPFIQNIDDDDRAGPVVLPHPRRVVSSLAFLERFTQAERIALRDAARQNAVLDDWLDLLRAAQEVDLDAERTVAGIAAFVNGALLTTKRAAEILT